MEIKCNGVEIHINPEEQSDHWLIDSAREIAEVANRRGLSLDLGALAVEAIDTKSVDTVEKIPLPEKLDAESSSKDLIKLRKQLEQEEFTGKTKESVSNALESIFSQLEFAYGGYTKILELLNDVRLADSQIIPADQDTIQKEFVKWFTVDKFAYVLDTQETDQSLSYTLVATPNTLVTFEDILKLTPEVYKDLYREITAEKLSGAFPDNNSNVILSLIPNRENAEFRGTVTEQRDRLAEMQIEKPFLKVPSVLDALTYWKTLEANPRKIADIKRYTEIRHFDLPENVSKRGFTNVPRSYQKNTDDFDTDNESKNISKLHLRRSDFGQPRNARLSIG